MRSAPSPRCPVTAPRRSRCEMPNLPREASISPNFAPHFRTFLSKARRRVGHATP